MTGQKVPGICWIGTRIELRSLYIPGKLLANLVIFPAFFINVQIEHYICHSFWCHKDQFFFSNLHAIMTYCPIKISMNRQRKNENYLNFKWKRQLFWIIHISVDNLSAWITQIIASFQSLWLNVLLTRKTITLAQITVWSVSDLQWTPTRANTALWMLVSFCPHFY